MLGGVQVHRLYALPHLKYSVCAHAKLALHLAQDIASARRHCRRGRRDSLNVCGCPSSEYRC